MFYFGPIMVRDVSTKIGDNKGTSLGRWVPTGNISYNVSFYRMLSAGQVLNSHPILKLKLYSTKKQDKNKIKCVSRQII